MCENRGTAGVEREPERVIRIGPWRAEPLVGELGEWGTYAPHGVEQERFYAEPGIVPGQLAWLVCGPD